VIPAAWARRRGDCDAGFTLPKDFDWYTVRHQGRPVRPSWSAPVKKPVPFGKYYLLERINVGGMAEVFRAKAYGVEGFERLVAVKRILPNIAED
jgi:hypothetical protein